MSVQELIDELQKLTPEQKQMPAHCHDGMDPFDLCPVKWISECKDYYSKEPHIEIRSA